MPVSYCQVEVLSSYSHPAERGSPHYCHMQMEFQLPHIVSTDDVLEMVLVALGRGENPDFTRALWTLPLWRGARETFYCQVRVKVQVTRGVSTDILMVQE